jgi:hypothetical protein
MVSSNILSAPYIVSNLTKPLVTLSVIARSSSHALALFRGRLFAQAIARDSGIDIGSLRDDAITCLQLGERAEQFVHAHI